MGIRYEKDGAIATITLENGKVNAFRPEMHRELHDTIKSFVSDRSIHVGILTGAGQRAFCGGDDIKAPNGVQSATDAITSHFFPSTDAETHLRPGWERELSQIERYKPIIGAINGPAVGMGFIYMMNLTDIRIGTPGAFLALPEIKYGMAGAGGSTQLARYLPMTVAMWMLLTGERLSPDDALKHSLYNEICKPERLMERAHAVAALVAAQPPISVRIEMELTRRAMDMPRGEAAVLTEHLYRLQRAAFALRGEHGGTPLASEK